MQLREGSPAERAVLRSTRAIGTRASAFGFAVRVVLLPVVLEIQFLQHLFQKARVQPGVERKIVLDQAEALGVGNGPLVLGSDIIIDQRTGTGLDARRR